MTAIFEWVMDVIRYAPGYIVAFLATTPWPPLAAGIALTVVIEVLRYRRRRQTRKDQP